MLRTVLQSEWWVVLALGALIVAPLFVALATRSRYFWWVALCVLGTPLIPFVWPVALALALTGRRSAHVVKAALAVVLVAAFVGGSASEALAWDHHRERKFEQKSATWPYPMWYWIKSTVDWNVKTAAECGNLYPCFGNIRWVRDYGEGAYEFDHWYENKNNSGQLANGVKWKSRVIGAEFYAVLPIGGLPLPQRNSAWIKIVIRTDGTSDVNVWSD